MTTIAADPPPLTVTPEGAIRVGGTRVTLDTVVYAYLQGDSAESIRDAYPSLQLADIHATIAYYLRHRAEVDAYIVRREAEAAAVRAENERRWPPDGLRRLLARRDAAK